MKHSEIVTEVAGREGISARNCKRVIEAYLAILRESIANEGQAVLPGIGTILIDGTSGRGRFRRSRAKADPGCQANAGPTRFGRASQRQVG